MVVLRFVEYVRKGLLKWSNDVSGMKVRVGATLSMGRGREKEREIEREEKRGAPSPKAPAFARQAQSCRINSGAGGRQTETNSDFLSFFIYPG